MEKIADTIDRPGKNSKYFRGNIFNLLNSPCRIMKTLPKAIIYGTMICLLMPCVQSAESEKNIIINSGFEEGIKGWGCYIPSKNAEWKVVEGGKTGKCLYIQGKTNGYHGGVKQKITLKPNTEYEVSIWIKMKNAEKLKAKELYLAGWIYLNGKEIWYSAIQPPFVVSNKSHDWLCVSKTFKTPAWDKVLQLEFYPVLFNNKGEIWIDDVKLIAVEDETGEPLNEVPPSDAKSE
ncbi:MAG: carbohydrate binding domain-containing protein [Victivallaceae bacterium]|nr:carbohydrate binding domain-containing protein [Victivallaceae bacterium]